MSYTDEGNPLLDERRDALRQTSKVSTLMVEHKTLGMIEAKVLDISRRGLRLLMPRVVPCGDEITIHSPKGMDLFTLHATIVRQSMIMKGTETWFECGIKVSDSATWRHVWFLTLRNGLPSEDKQHLAA